MVYFNAVYRAALQQIPCSVCGQANGRQEFYERQRRHGRPVLELKSAYPRQGLLETAARLPGLIPICGACHAQEFPPANLTELAPITSEMVDDLAITIRRRVFRLRDYRKLYYAPFAD